MSDDRPKIGHLLPQDASTEARLMSHSCAWAQAVKGLSELEPLVAQLTQIVKAEAAVLSRFDTSTGRRQTICLADPRGKSLVIRGLSKGISGEILGRHLFSVKSGVAVYLSEMRREPGFEMSPGTGRLLQDRMTREVVSIILSTAPSVDILELHFSRLITGRDDEHLRNFGACAVALWRDRVAGLVQRMLQSNLEKNGDAGALDGAAILDISNPAGLSRAEFGVCLLIRKGFTSSRISEELNVAKSTVKSHLRNIYSKTDTAGQVDLMYRLLNEPDPQDAVAVA